MVRQGSCPHRDHRMRQTRPARHLLHAWCGTALVVAGGAVRGVQVDLEVKLGGGPGREAVQLGLMPLYVADLPVLPLATGTL